MNQIIARDCVEATYLVVAGRLLQRSILCRCCHDAARTSPGGHGCGAPRPDRSAVAAVTERSSVCFARLVPSPVSTRWRSGWVAGSADPTRWFGQAAVVIFGGDHGVAAQR
ncbi:MAG: hypothetical protein R2710_16335 [Acidimicrobiales bacterium]